MIFFYFASILLSLLFSDFAPPDRGPINACFESSQTLTELVDCLEVFTVLQGFYDQYSYLEAQPSVTQREAWFTAISTLLHTNSNCSSAIVPSVLQDVYDAVTFTDRDGQSFCVLYERSICPCSKFVKKGWGFMIVPASENDVFRHIHLSGPHPFFDGETSEQATQLFKETGAKSLLIPGRLRTAYPAPSNCIMGPPGTTYFMTDPAHNDLEPFFDANVAIWQWQLQHGGCPSTSCAFIQLHGKGDTTCPEDTIFLSAGLGPGHSAWYMNDVDRPIKRLKKELLAAFNSGIGSTPPATISLPSDSMCGLTARKNVVGRYLNYLPSPISHDVCRQNAKTGTTQGVFIHAEQSAPGRSVASRAAWIQALKNTFSEVNNSPCLMSE